jgi:hypothetical protein
VAPRLRYDHAPGARAVYALRGGCTPLMLARAGAGPYWSRVKLHEWLRRLWPRRAGRSAAERNRYDEAARLEERTQSHYRSVTDSDARGRATKDPGSSTPKS